MSKNGPRYFEDVRGGQPKHNKGCARCGAERNAGSVAVHLSQLKPTGTMSGRVASRAKSLCEPCSVEVYELLVDVLLREARVDTEAPA